MVQLENKRQTTRRDSEDSINHTTLTRRLTRQTDMTTEYERLSPEGKVIYDRSIEFFKTHQVPLVMADEIPDDLLKAWITPDPLRLMLMILGEVAEPDDILPLVLYMKAYKFHDAFYSDILDMEYRTPLKTMIRHFDLYQKALRRVVKLRERNKPAPFGILHFAIYSDNPMEIVD